MPMTVVVTNKVASRTRGFLASCMFEIAPGLYAHPHMNKAVRERMWSVVVDWASTIEEGGGVAMFWPQKSAPSGMGMELLEWPKKELIEYEGHWMVRSALTAEHDRAELDALAHQGAELPLDIQELVNRDWLWLTQILEEE